ncbi:RcnB family protein [Arenimonas fontis]|uniref:RcnB family protein n=1 Tax=Arenimonas fontis TaxID=2608255 RepID=A0A5B2Z8K8_9GAMM|nr:RcnB family protein [Arenimonas fontis]KAA2285048.1 RcnB family protein [Arenimonas fontis]
MNKLAFASAALLLAGGMAGPVLADPDRREDRREWRQEGRENRHDRREDRRDWRAERREDRRDWRHDRREDRRDWRHERRDDHRAVVRHRGHQPVWRDHRPEWRRVHYSRHHHHHHWDGWYWAPQYRYRPPYRYVYPRGYHYTVWHVGYRLPPPFYARHYHLDYRYYRLPPPPHGHVWVRVDSDVVLVALATGIVLDVFFDVFG